MQPAHLFRLPMFGAIYSMLSSLNNSSMRGSVFSFPAGLCILGSSSCPNPNAFYYLNATTLIQANMAPCPPYQTYHHWLQQSALYTEARLKLFNTTQILHSCAPGGFSSQENLKPDSWNPSSRSLVSLSCQDHIFPLYPACLHTAHPY